MWSSHLAGLLVLAALLFLWASVQRAFRRSFPEPGGDPDALAGRTSCGGPRCALGTCETREPCPRRASGAPHEDGARAPQQDGASAPQEENP